jgi:hypothetical protein
MAIVAGFDVHRARVTFDALDWETGKVYRGRIRHTRGGAALGRPPPGEAGRGGGGLHGLAVRVLGAR